MNEGTDTTTYVLSKKENNKISVKISSYIAADEFNLKNCLIKNHNEKIK